MHIVEVNEHLDYPKFWAHGHSIEEWGPMTWEMWEGMADSFPCSTCKPGAQAIAHGGHDIVNLIRGKKVQTANHLKTLIDMAKWAEKQYIGKHCTGGNCGSRVRHIG